MRYRFRNPNIGEESDRFEVIENRGDRVLVVEVETSRHLFVKPQSALLKSDLVPVSDCPAVAEASSQYSKIQAFKARKDLSPKQVAVAVKQGKFQVQLVGYKPNGNSEIVPVSEWLSKSDAYELYACVNFIL